MTQDNLFNNSPNHFQPSPFSALYPNDMSLQFAATVPHRTSPQQRPQVPLNFNQSPFQNGDTLIQQQFLSTFPGSPYERPKTSNRQAQMKAEKRAEHNAIERARRESLNVKFQQLALTLPNLQNDTRPSKSTIIDRTLDFVRNAISKEEKYQRRIQELEKFNSYLLAQSEQRLHKKQVKKPMTRNLPDMIEQGTTNGSDSSSEDEDDGEQEDKEQQQDMFIPPHPITPSVTGVHNPHPLINSVSPSSVQMMPKSYTTTWIPPASTTEATYQQHAAFLQQSLTTPKFQNLSKLERNPQDQFLLNNNNNANFMLNTDSEQNFHHLMHRR